MRKCWRAALPEMPDGNGAAPGPEARLVASSAVRGPGAGPG
jgi:hypothetical protein